jgi:hypothetical protein
VLSVAFFRRDFFRSAAPGQWQVAANQKSNDLGTIFSNGKYLVFEGARNYSLSGRKPENCETT